MDIQEQEIKFGLAIVARHIDAYGEKYWPIFERLESDLEARRDRAKRLQKRMKYTKKYRLDKETDSWS